MSSPAKEQLERRQRHAVFVRSFFSEDVLEAFRNAQDGDLVVIADSAPDPVSTFVDDFEVYIGFATSPGVTDVPPDGVKPDHEIEVQDGE